MGDGKVNYVNFGGVLIPENARKVTMNGNNGKMLYCVFLDDKNFKVTYPKQTTKESNRMEYKYLTGSYSVLSHKFNLNEQNISKSEFDSVWNKARSTTSCENLYSDSVRSYYKGNKNYRHVELNESSYNPKHYYEQQVSTTPKIESDTSGIIFNTNKIKLSNINGATVYGSDDEDNIILENSSDCFVDVSDENNNILFNDKVTVINGSGNKIKSGDNDKTEFKTYNYTTANSNTKSKHTGKGLFIQPAGK